MDLNSLPNNVAAIEAVGSAVQRQLQNRFQSFWHKWIDRKLTCSKDSKFDFLSKVKRTFEYEPYLDSLADKKLQSMVTKLRLSNHCLEIETGRHCKRDSHVERADRICRLCKTEVEDEIHFLYTCPTLSPCRTFHDYVAYKHNLTNIFRFSPCEHDWDSFAKRIYDFALYLDCLYKERCKYI